MTVKERVRASRVVEKARQNTAYTLSFFYIHYSEADSGNRMYGYKRITEKSP